MYLKRKKSHSGFLGSANYGLNVSRNLTYFGYKLISLTTLDGSPNIYFLVQANPDECLTVEALIDYLLACDLMAEKGFIGVEWQTRSLTRLII